MATDWNGLWHALNARQQEFLMTLYTLECEHSRYYLSQRGMTDPRKREAEWRWMEHGVVGSLRLRLVKQGQAVLGELGKRLEAHGYADEGIGATYTALETRGYLERRYTGQQTLFGTVEILWVRLTRQGRKLVSMHADVKPYRPGAWRRGLEEQVKDLLETPERFRAWLEEQPKKAIVGGSFSRPEKDMSNPLARFLDAQGISSAWVEVGRSAYWVGYSRKANPLPAWALQFAQACSGSQDALERLGDLLRTRRGERGLRDVAEELEAWQISPTTLSRVEQGKKTDAETIRILCDWLGIDAAPFLEPSTSAPRVLTREQALVALEQGKVVSG